MVEEGYGGDFGGVSLEACFGGETEGCGYDGTRALDCNGQEFKAATRAWKDQ